jgi:hypothetical protein
MRKLAIALLVLMKAYALEGVTACVILFARAMPRSVANW